MGFLRRAAKPAPLPDAERAFLEATEALNLSPHGGHLRSWLESERKKLYTLMELAEDIPTLRLLQGRAAALKELLDALNGAGDRLEKASAARPQQGVARGGANA